MGPLAVQAKPEVGRCSAAPAAASADSTLVVRTMAAAR
jgi:hypothetical protein